MKEMLLELLMAVIAAAIPVLTTFVVKYINKAKEEAMSSTDSMKWEWYIQEIANAITAAVSATSQTYVDALKKAGKFDAEAQREAAQMALDAALAAISPAAKEFIEQMYGDLVEFMTTRIEAEVRKQKQTAPVEIGLPVLESTNSDAAGIAASTAAATAATMIQTAIHSADASAATAENTPEPDRE